MMLEHLLCRRTDVHVANLEFGASLIPATNSHRTRNVAHVAEGFSREHPEHWARPSLWRLTDENCASRLLSTTHHPKSAVLIHLVIATDCAKMQKSLILCRCAENTFRLYLRALVDVISYREFKISKCD